MVSVLGRQKKLSGSNGRPSVIISEMCPSEPKCNSVETEAAEQFVGRALERLKALGMRLTGPRRMVVRVLAERRKPLGAYQIRDQVLAAGGKIDVVSVYRILAGLVEAGLAHRIGSVDGYLACSGVH